MLHMELVIKPHVWKPHSKMLLQNVNINTFQLLLGPCFSMQICQNIFGLAVINSAFLINRLPTKVLSNQSTIQIIRNPSFYECTKHFELDCHIVREKLNSGLIHLLPISTKLQLADIFTKSLHPSPFSSIISKFGMVNIHSPTCSRGSENSSLSPAQFDPAKCSPD